jgi:hypothetical protein
MQDERAWRGKAEAFYHMVMRTPSPVHCIRGSWDIPILPIYSTADDVRMLMQSYSKSKNAHNRVCSPFFILNDLSLHQRM